MVVPPDRLSAGDLTILATDSGPVPMQIAAVLRLAPMGRPDRDELVGLLAERLRTVPRLRQRLVHTSARHGRPYWVDDHDFDLEPHLSVRVLADEDQALLDVAAELVCARPTGGGPSGAVAWSRVTRGGARAGHRPAPRARDGLGGLAVLGALADPPGPTSRRRPVPRRHRRPRTHIAARPGCSVPCGGAWPACASWGSTSVPAWRRAPR